MTKKYKVSTEACEAVALVTDGRFSGATRGICVGHGVQGRPRADLRANKYGRRLKLYQVGKFERIAC